MRTMTALVIAGALACVGGCANQRGPSAACNGPNSCCVVPTGERTAVDAKTAEALRTAIQDERRARAFYNNVLAKHGQARPFSNIVHAEERHEQVIAALMERHGVTVPDPDIGPLPAIPDTLRECNSMAARFERENIDLYDRLLADVREPDIRAAFQNLQSASRNNHLPAFERWAAAANAGSPAFGRGLGRGRGPGAGTCIGVCGGPCWTTP